MKSFTNWAVFVIAVFCISYSAKADGFSLEQYMKFYQGHDKANYDTAKAMNKQNVYIYYSAPECSAANSEHFPAVRQQFNLTNDEIQLLEKNDFVVLDKKKYDGFFSAITDYWYRDMPLYINSDALLFAFHKSYDDILKNLENDYFRQDLETILRGLYQPIPSGLADTLKLVYETKNLYVGVALALLLDDQSAYTSTNPEFTALYNDIMQSITGESFGYLKVFPASENRMYDFSQLKPRGHYEDDPLLRRYFKAMMWLGRTELYLLPPNAEFVVPDYSLRIQTAVSYLIAKTINENSQMLAAYNDINNIISSFVGEQDNVMSNHILDIASEIELTSIEQLYSEDMFKEFQDSLITKPYADQKILSQCLVKSCDGTQIKPAAAFMVFGSRFIFDSFVFSNLVYDKVDGRMMPKTMDVLYVLGNNSAGEFLQADFYSQKYSQNILSLRYLLDSYGEDFWNSSVYNNWLNAIKSLNPPSDIEHLPKYMQTPAWWQMKMNTQLGSWATLRHDNLLYAKQSYTGMPSCDFPDVMVEPVPEFYDAMIKMNNLFAEKLKAVNSEKFIGIREFLYSCSDIIDSIKIVAEKQINNIQPTAEEISFLKSMYAEENQGCVTTSTGWYKDLFYGNEWIDNIETGKEHLIADVHTQPADEDGNIVGKVLHIGTGYVNPIIIKAKDVNGQCKVYVGPVFSYYEYITENFERLTDSEWKEMFDNGTAINRPNFTDLYLADSEGNMAEGAIALQYILGVEQEQPNMPKAQISVSPNPFISNTNVWLKIDNMQSYTDFSIEIYDENGILVRNVMNESVSGGNFVIKWDGKNNIGEPVSKGVYIIRAILNGKVYSGKLIKG